MTFKPTRMNRCPVVCLASELHLRLLNSVYREKSIWYTTEETLAFVEEVAGLTEEL